MAERELEKYEQNAIDTCPDEEYRLKLKKWVMKHKAPLDNYDLKKLKDKVEKFNRKHNKTS